MYSGDKEERIGEVWMCWVECMSKDKRGRGVPEC